MSIFYTDEISIQNLPQNVKITTDLFSRQNAKKKPGLCAHTPIQRIMFFSSKYLHYLQYIHRNWVKRAGFWVKLTPMKWAVYTASEACM